MLKKVSLKGSLDSASNDNLRFEKNKKFEKILRKIFLSNFDYYV